jgi:hypothetical protein
MDILMLLETMHKKDLISHYKVFCKMSYLAENISKKDWAPFL